MTKARSMSFTPPGHPLVTGWPIIASLFLAAAVLFGVSIYSYILLIDNMAVEHGWTPSQTGSLVSAMWIVAPAALFGGTLVKRFGAIPLIVTGLLLEGVAFTVMNASGSFPFIYAVRMVMGFGKVLTVVSMPVLLVQCFPRNFSTAMAIVWSGAGFGGLVMSIATEALLTSAGFTATVWIVAALPAGLALVIFAASRNLGGIIRRQSGTGVLHAADTGGASSEAVLSPREVLRSINWLTALLMLLAVAGVGMSSIAIQSQQPGLLKAAGLSPAIAASVLGVTSAAVIAGTISAGWLLDRYPARWTGLLMILLMYGGLLAYLVVLNRPEAVIAIVGALAMGVYIGGSEILWIDLTKRQFGPEKFATTYGGWYFALQLGYALGGGIGGWSFETWGGTGIIVCAGLMFLPPAILSLWRPAMRE